MLFIQVFMLTWHSTIFRGVCYLCVSFQRFFHRCCINIWKSGRRPCVLEFSFASGSCSCSSPVTVFVWFLPKCNTHAPWKRYSCEIKRQRFSFYLLEWKPLLYNFCMLAGAFLFEQCRLWNADYNVIVADQGRGSCWVTVIAQGINSNKSWSFCCQYWSSMTLKPSAKTVWEAGCNMVRYLFLNHTLLCLMFLCEFCIQHILIVV